MGNFVIVDGDERELCRLTTNDKGAVEKVEKAAEGLEWIPDAVHDFMGDDEFSVSQVTRFLGTDTEYRRLDEVGKNAEVELSADGAIAKTDDERQMIFGWAYVTHDREGNVNVDKSGDFIDAVEEIEKSAYDFVLNSRNGDFDHTNIKSAEMVESMVFTPEKIEKMGLPQGSIPLGWWIGFHIPDKADWEVAKTKKAFSIHGKGTRKAWDGDK